MNASFLLAIFSGYTAEIFAQKPEPGDQVRDFRLRDIHGNEVDTASWRGSPGVWLFVSASQKSSEQAIRQLQNVIDNLDGRRAEEKATAKVEAAVLTGETQQIAYFREFCTRHDIRVPVVLDDLREVYGRVGVIVLPTTILLDRRGRLHRVLPGYTLDYEQQLRAHLAFLTGRIDADELERALDARASRPDRARDRAERLCQLADSFVRRRLLKAAETELRRAIETDPGYAPGYLRLAELTAARGRFDEAEKLVAAVERLEPENHQTKLTLGIVRFRQGRLADAETLLNQALILNPDPVRTNYWLGRLYERRGLHREAAARYRAAVERLAPSLSEGGAGTAGTER